MDISAPSKQQGIIIGIILMVLLLGIILVNVIKNNQHDDFVQKFIETEQRQIDSSYKVSERKIDSLLVLIQNNKKQLDEIQKFKQEIRLIYVEKDAKIDTLGYVGIVAMFKSIFAKGGIK